VPIDIYKDKFLWFSPARVSKLNFVYRDFILHAFTILKTSCGNDSSGNGKN
jgi:hypothetical protein